MNRRVRKRLQPTLGDYLAIAVGPLLIGLLVGSMVFLLIEAFYEGQFGGRLQFIMAWFVVGAVGISRISIEEGREHAALFAVPLGILVAIAAWRYVEFSGPLQAFSPLVSIGLVALIWWSTDCLTWDCTVLDEDDTDGDAGIGLLETAGLEGGNGGHADARDADAVTARDVEPQGWWERFREIRRRPHAPGVWVLYFSLAALPLFGLGQLLLPTGDETSTRFVFLLLVVYVAAGLGLLLITSFLNLRRYLRKRRLVMPPTMAITWVVSGTLLIAGILLVCLVLAGSGVGYSVADLPLVASVREGLATSRWAASGEGVEREENARQVSDPDAEQVRPGEGDEAGGGEGGEQDGEATEDRSQAPGDRPRGEQQQTADNSQAAGRERPRAIQAGEQQTGQPQGTGEANAGEGEQSGDARSSPADEGQSGAGQPQPEPSAERTAEAAGGAEPEGSQAPPQMPDVSGVGGWLKVLGWIMAAIVLGGGLWWYRHAILAGIGAVLERLRELLRGLFAGRETRAAGQTASSPAAPPRRRTFAEFADPFASGAAEGASADELIGYSFEAFEAWSGDLGFRRRPQQTAHEFVEVVGERLPAIAREAEALAELVSWSRFANDPVPRSKLKHLERLWRRMRREQRRGPEEAAAPGTSRPASRDRPSA